MKVICVRKVRFDVLRTQHLLARLQTRLKQFVARHRLLSIRLKLRYYPCFTVEHHREDTATVATKASSCVSPSSSLEQMGLASTILSAEAAEAASRKLEPSRAVGFN